MAGRRTTNNQIRGPQSALTDFLASNNISAAQISADYERRQREARQQQDQEVPTNGESTHQRNHEERVVNAIQKKKRKRQEEKALAKIKEGKDYKRQKKRKDEGSDWEDEDFSWDMYKKKKPLPGQLENCENCEKRFTVTAYSKTGPAGGLLCTRCSKEQEDQKKKNQKSGGQIVNRDKRRHVQSSLLDGIVQIGSKPLQELCIKEVANNIHDVDEFGDLPQSLLNRLSQILSRRRVITSRTLDLFLRPNLETIDVYDCGKLETKDYVRMFSVVPKVMNLNLRNAGQFKDEVLDYIIERAVPIRNLQLDATNLVSNGKWTEFFEKRGQWLEGVKFSWLDYSMDDIAFTSLICHCPNIKRLKVKKCFRLGDVALGTIANLEQLEHLSLRFSTTITASILADLISSVGSGLRTLSLEGFSDADDTVLSTIHASCTRLSKLRFTENDSCTDTGFTSLFTHWSNPALAFADFSSDRSVDYAIPDGPEDPVGLASRGFEALMGHSGSRLERLNIGSCRHISYESFSKVFNGKEQYPLLKDIDISFLPKIDTSIVAGMFRSCPALIKVTAFGCFNVTEVTVPKGTALIGVPNAQDSIVQEGDFGADLCYGHTV